MAFPVSPTNGQLHALGGKIFSWNSTKGVWKATTAINTGNVAAGNLTVVGTIFSSDIRLGGESLADRLTSVNSTISASGNTVSNALSIEIVNRISADTALSVRIDGISNQVSVTSADLVSAKSNLLSNINVVSNALSNEISNRISAVNVVSNALSAEIVNRASADTALGIRIDAVSQQVSVTSADLVSAKNNLLSNINVVSNALSAEIVNRCLLYTSPSPRDES
jgi:hypothetical protein